MAHKTPNHRPFTPCQQRQNAAFLAALRQTGNVRLACRQLGVHRATYTKRRAKCAAFATEWDMNLAAAHAAFRLAGGARMPEPGKGKRRAVIARSGATKQSSLDRHGARASRDDEGLRTKGGEPTIVRLANGRLQLRLAPPGRMTKAAEQRFFATLSETANIRLAAAASGFAHSSFLARARLRPDFARELEVSRRIGRDRVQWQWLEGRRRDPEDWPFDVDRPIPRMTAEQAMLQLIYHAPDGPFRRSLWRRRTPPPAIERVAPRIRARLSAFARAEYHARTGRWRYEDE